MGCKKGGKKGGCKVSKSLDLARDIRSANGFSLVELLVVVSIIAILSFTVVTNLSSARAKARDAKVMSDLSEVGKAVSLYQANGDDVAGLKGVTFDGAMGVLRTANLIPANATIKHPVSNRSYSYKGQNDPSNVAELSFVLCGELEKPSDNTKPWYVVDNGSSYMNATNLCQ